MQPSSSFSLPGPWYGPLPPHAREWRDIAKSQMAFAEKQLFWKRCLALAAQRASAAATARALLEHGWDDVLAELLAVVPERD